MSDEREREQKGQGLDPDESPTTEESPHSGVGGHEQTHGTVVDEDSSDVVKERAEEAD